MAKQPACMLYVVPPTYWLGCVCKPVVVAARRFRWFNLRLGLLLVRADRFQNIAVQIVAEQRRVEDFFFIRFALDVVCFVLFSRCSSSRPAVIDTYPTGKNRLFGQISRSLSLARPPILRTTIRSWDPSRPIVRRDAVLQGPLERSAAVTHSGDQTDRIGIHLNNLAWVTGSDIYYLTTG